MLLEWLKFHNKLRTIGAIDNTADAIEETIESVYKNPLILKEIAKSSGNITAPLSSIFIPMQIGTSDNEITTGSLMITLMPIPVISLGAKWRIKGTVKWMNTETRLSGLNPGNYIVEFKEVDHYFPVPDLTVVIKKGEISHYHVLYQYHSTKGHLTVTLSPQEAIDTNAAWRRKGTSKWFLTGEQEQNVEAGYHIIEFRDSAPYFEPTETPVLVVAMENRSYSFEYLPIIIKGSLLVNIGPDLARSAGAKWRLVGTSDWFDSGYELKNITEGTYSVEFSNPNTDVFIIPAPESISITNFNQTQVNVEYNIYGVPVPTLDNIYVTQGEVVTGKKRLPPATVTVTIIGGEGYIEPLVQTVPYRSTATFDVVGLFIIKDNNESPVIGGTAP